MKGKELYLPRKNALRTGKNALLCHHKMTKGNVLIYCMALQKQVFNLLDRDVAAT